MGLPVAAHRPDSASRYLRYAETLARARMRRQRQSVAKWLRLVGMGSMFAFGAAGVLIACYLFSRAPI